jgi:hypothetical protein
LHFGHGLLQGFTQLTQLVRFGAILPEIMSMSIIEAFVE